MPGISLISLFYDFPLSQGLGDGALKALALSISVSGEMSVPELTKTVAFRIHWFFHADETGFSPTYPTCNGGLLAAGIEKLNYLDWVSFVAANLVFLHLWLWQFTTQSRSPTHVQLWVGFGHADTKKRGGLYFFFFFFFGFWNFYLLHSLYSKTFTANFSPILGKKIILPLRCQYFTTFVCLVILVLFRKIMIKQAPM